MTEKEYIEREAALLKIMQTGTDARTIDTIMTLPAADVAPVVHGWWSFAIGYDPRRSVKCCECERMAFEPSNYCPNCGAKMDLEG